MNIHLLIDYYIPSMEERQKELDYCYIDNINNPNFNKVHIFYQDTPPKVNDRVILVPLDGRNTYQDYIQYSIDNIPEGDIVVLSNSDIYFDNTIAKVKQFDLDKHVLTLTRWSSHGTEDGNRLINGEVIYYKNHHCSQDVWIWKNPLNNTPNTDTNFPMGVPGCDNKIAYAFKEMGYLPINPCLDIIIYQYHQTGEASRTYNRATDRLPLPYYFVKALTYNMLS